MAKKTQRKVKKKRVRLAFNEGIATIHASINNTIITLSDKTGNVLTWSSGGKIGYKGSKKSTPFAAQVAAEEVAKTALNIGITQVKVLVNGPGAGRESAIRALDANGLRIIMIKDVTAIPHNGCRPRKMRRI